LYNFYSIILLRCFSSYWNRYIRLARNYSLVLWAFSSINIHFHWYINTFYNLCLRLIFRKNSGKWIFLLILIRNIWINSGIYSWLGYHIHIICINSSIFKRLGSGNCRFFVSTRLLIAQIFVLNLVDLIHYIMTSISNNYCMPNIRSASGYEGFSYI